MNTGLQRLHAAAQVDSKANEALHVASLDFDGTLAYSRWDTKKIIARAAPLLTQIAQDASTPNLILMIGSLRQSKELDDYNSRTYKTVSCFAIYPELAEKLKTEYKLNCQLNDFLFPDLLCDAKSYGQTFKQAIDIEFTGKHRSIRCIYGKKASLLYAQIHHIATQNKDKKIVFDFYDDRDQDILSELRNIFSTNPQLLPKNVTLRLHHFVAQHAATPTIHSLKATIPGKGCVDENFANNALHFNQLLSQKDDINPRTRAIRNQHLAIFMKSRNLFAVDDPRFQAAQKAYQDQLDLAEKNLSATQAAEGKADDKPHHGLLESLKQEAKRIHEQNKINLQNKISMLVKQLIEYQNTLDKKNLTLFCCCYSITPYDAVTKLIQLLRDESHEKISPAELKYLKENKDILDLVYGDTTCLHIVKQKLPDMFTNGVYVKVELNSMKL